MEINERDYGTWATNYNAVQKSMAGLSLPQKIEFMREELAYHWQEVYQRNLDRETELYRLESGSFSYVYDDLQALVRAGKVADDGISDSRILVTFVTSTPNTISRKHDDIRRRGWVGATEKMFGKQYDKGHFIAHSIGGAIDRAEYNVFVQSRSVNRGWGEAGKLYRKMEEYGKQHAGVFCFSRPFYTDGTAFPRWLEYGILKEDGELWVEVFDNRPDTN